MAKTNAVHRHLTADSLRRLQMLKDQEWSMIEPIIPVAPQRGRPRIWPVRLVFEAILYLMTTGCHWRLLPPQYPPKSTVHRYMSLWRDLGLFEKLNYLLVVMDREREGREASPTAGVIDAKSVKNAVTGRIRGYDAGKKVLGVKWHILVDTGGRLLLVQPDP